MSVAKVIEIIAEGDSIEGAIEAGVREASQTVRNIRAVNVENIKGLVEKSQVVRYRVDLKITFVVED
jgi:flavin-binding protein dodecin